MKTSVAAQRGHPHYLFYLTAIIGVTAGRFVKYHRLPFRQGIVKSLNMSSSLLPCLILKPAIANRSFHALRNRKRNAALFHWVSESYAGRSQIGDRYSGSPGQPGHLTHAEFTLVATVFKMHLLASSCRLRQNRQKLRYVFPI